MAPWVEVPRGGWGQHCGGSAQLGPSGDFPRPCSGHHPPCAGPQNLTAASEQSVLQEFRPAVHCGARRPASHSPTGRQAHTVEPEAVWTPDSAAPNSTAASMLASPLPFLFSSGCAWTTASKGTRAASWYPTWDCYSESFLPEHHICWSSSSVAPRSQATAGCTGEASAREWPILKWPGTRLQDSVSTRVGVGTGGLSSGLYSHYRAPVAFNTDHPCNHPIFLPNAIATRSQSHHPIPQSPP